VYYKYNTGWSYSILDKSARSFEVPNQLPGAGTLKIPLSAIAVSAVDRLGNESAIRVYSLN
jgi:hypothetical protein